MAPSLTSREPSREEQVQELLHGLMLPQKEIPPKWFYDERGSALFVHICDLDEYYLTRTEQRIMQDNIVEIVERISSDCVLIEYGSGSSVKIRLLLDHLDHVAAYVPIDISAEHLSASVKALALDHPRLRILPVHADYTREFELPHFDFPFSHKAVFYPGSSIGNFTPEDARIFFQRVASVVGQNGGMLIGVDLKKDPAILHRAYNDSEGVTAAFNLNVLSHLNSAIGANFDLGRFEHRAFYNEAKSRIEMHLVSTDAQEVSLDGTVISFAKGETIHTENSYKYSIEEFRALVDGFFDVRKVWTDSKHYFSVQHLVRVG